MAGIKIRIRVKITTRAMPVVLARQGLGIEVKDDPMDYYVINNNLLQKHPG